MAQAWEDEDPLTMEALNIELDAYGLPLLEEELHWEQLRGEFDPPEGFRFHNQRHSETIKFMNKEGLHSYWKPDKDMKRVMNEMVGNTNRRIQHIVHILLMGEVPQEVIASKVSEQLRLTKSLTIGMISYYRHYFWRVNSLTVYEWEALLQGDPHFDKYIASLYCGPKQALFRAGMFPEYDFRQALRDTHRQVAFRLEYLAHKPDDKQVISQLISLSREQRSLYDVLYGEGGGLEDEMRKIRRFLMTHTIPDVKTLDELIKNKGSYSDDGSDDLPSKKKR